MVCLRLSQMLQKEGHDIVFITTPFNKKDTSEHIYQIPMPLRGFGLLSLIFPFDIPSLLYSMRILKRLKPDIIHLHTKYLFLPVLISSIILRIPIVLTVLDYFIICPRNILRRPDGQICKHFHDATCSECFPRLRFPSLRSKSKLRAKRSNLKITKQKLGESPKKNQDGRNLEPKDDGSSQSRIFEIVKSPSAIVKKLFEFFISGNLFLLPPLLQKTFFYCRSVIFDYLIRKLDAIIVLSETSKDRLEQYGVSKSKIKVIYHYQLDYNPLPPSTGVSVSIPTSFENPTILFVGSLYEHKGLHILIKAVPHVIREIPNARLIIVGTGTNHAYIDEIRNDIRNLGIEGSVEFLGKKENKEVMRLIEMSDVVVVPEQWLNDFGPVILVEAMALAKAVVASKIGGTSEFVEDGISGFLVTYDQPRQFAEKIIWLLQHKEAAQLMGENAQKSAQFLYNKETAKEVINLYSACCRG